VLCVHTVGHKVCVSCSSELPAHRSCDALLCKQFRGRRSVDHVVFELRCRSSMRFRATVLCLLMEIKSHEAPGTVGALVQRFRDSIPVPIIEHSRG